MPQNKSSSEINKHLFYTIVTTLWDVIWHCILANYDVIQNVSVIVWFSKTHKLYTFIILRVEKHKISKFENTLQA